MAFKIGPLTIHLYGIIIMLGALAAAWLASVEAKRRGENPELVWDILLWVLIGGVIGARIWHILTPPASMVAEGITTRYYLTHPLAAIAIWRGGLGLPGALMGGLLAFYLFARARKINFVLWLDIAAPAIALAQSIGRWGNYVNQELYGAPTNLPWAIYIDPEHRLPKFADKAYYHPLFFYESVWDLLNMALLLYLARKHGDKLFTGDLFLIYLMVYSFGRFMLEFIRLDRPTFGSFDVNQVLMGIVAVGSAAALIWRHRNGAPAPQRPKRRRR